jgi:endo-1,3(4)-beta-glucanase
MVYAIHDLGNSALAQAGLNNLKQSFALFANNNQKYPLVYETAWGGVVSTSSYVTLNPGVDFGNTYYNDHHFQ